MRRSAGGIAAFAALVVAMILVSRTARAEEPFAAGNCAVTRQAVVLEDADGKAVGPELPAASYLKILSARAGAVEVVWIPSLLDGCQQAAGVFAGWVRRGDMAEEHERFGRNPYPTAHPGKDAPLFDRPEGRAVGGVRKNAMLWVVARRGEWLMIATDTGRFAPTSEAWVQPRGWVGLAALEPFVLADPADVTASAARVGVTFDWNSDDVAVQGHRFAWKDVCPDADGPSALFLTRVAAFPVAGFCGPTFDGEPGNLALVPVEGKPRTKRLRKGSSAISDATILKALKALLAPAAKPARRG